MVLVSCGIPSQRSAHEVAREEVPFGLLDGSTPDITSDVVGALPVETLVHLVQDEAVVPVTRRVDDEGASSIMSALLEGPNAKEQALGLRSALVSPDIVTSVEQSGGSVRVDLAPAFAEIPAPEQRLALAQLTYTLTGLPRVASVIFTLDGEETSVPRADGTASDGPVTREDYEPLVAGGEPSS
jgi:spore germination protein GerM